MRYVWHLILCGIRAAVKKKTHTHKEGQNRLFTKAGVNEDKHHEICMSFLK